VAFGVAVGVAGEGAEFLAALAQGVGGFGMLPRVAVVVVVEGEQAGMGEVVGRLWAGGELLRLLLQVLQPLRFTPVRNRTLRCVGHRYISPCEEIQHEVADSCRATAIEQEGTVILPARLALLHREQVSHTDSEIGRKRRGEFVVGVQDGRLEWRSVAHHALRFGEQQPHLLRARLEILADLAQEVGHILTGRHNFDSEVGRAVAEAVGQFTVGQTLPENDADIGHADVARRHTVACLRSREICLIR